MPMHVCIFCSALFVPSHANHARCADCKKRGINANSAPCIDCGELRPRGKGSLPPDEIRCHHCRRRAWGLSTDELVKDRKVPARPRPRHAQCRRCDAPVPEDRVAYCSSLCAGKRKRTYSRSTSGRGYGRPHQRLREQLLPQAYGEDCHLCGAVMLSSQELHLDHTPDRTGYRGMAHAWCNSLDGLRRAQEALRRKRLGVSA